MRYWVTWKWYRNGLLNGICSDEIVISEPITSVDVVMKAVKSHVGEPMSQEVEMIFAWSKFDEPCTD